MKRLRRVLRLSVYLLSLVLVLLATAAAVLTLTAPGRETLAGMISSLASSEASKVQVGGLSGIWSGNLRIDHVVLEDADGPWLVARGVTASVSPWSLLSSRADAESVRADRVEIARLPKSESTSDEPFSLPVSIKINRIDLPVIALGQALAGDIAEISLEGSLTAEPEPLTVTSSLQISRNDGKAGSLAATIDFAPADNRLDIDVKGAEPVGGVLANFLRLPGAPPVAIAITGSGPASNWKGEGTFSVNGAVVTELSAVHQITERGNHIEALGRGEFQPFVPAIAQPLLAGSTSFDIAGTMLTAGGFDIERANLVSASASASASGQYDPAGASDLSVALTTPNGPLQLKLGSETAPIEVALSRFVLRAFGAGDAPALDASADIVSLSTDQAEITGLTATAHSDGFDLATRTGPVVIDAKADTAGAADQTIASLLAGAVSAHIEATVDTSAITVSTATVESGTQTSMLSGVVSRDDGSLSVKLKSDILSTAMPAAVRPVLGERTAVSGDVSRDANGKISADGLTVSSGDFSASGSASLSGERIEASIDGALKDIGRLAEGTSGAIGFSAKATGLLGAPALDLTVTSDRFTAAGRDITGLELTASGVANAAAPQATVSLKGTVGDEALSGTAVLKSSDGKREVSNLDLSLGQNRISGNLSLDASFIPEGTVDFTLPDLGPLAALALETVSGEMSGTIRFARPNGVPEIAIDAKTGKLVRGTIAAAGVSASASIRDYLGSPTVSGKVTAGSVTAGGASIVGLDLTLGRDGEWTSFSSAATFNSIPAKAVGRVRLADGLTTIELASGEAIIRGLKAALTGQSTVLIKGGTTSLDRLALAVGGGRVEVTGTAGDRLDLNIRLAAMPASIINSFAPGVGAGGTIAGTARVTGAPSNPDVGYTIDWRGATTSQTSSAGFGAMTVASSGTLSGGRLKLTVTAGDGSGLGLKGGGEVLMTGARSLSLDVSGTVPFGFLTGRLASQGLSLTGGANVSLSVRGAAASPNVSGTIRSTGVRFLDARSGIAVNDIDAQISIANGVATVTRLTGGLSSGGSITGKGTVSLDAARGFPADLAIDIANGRYTDGEIVTTTLNGALAVKGPLSSAPVLSGTINLGKTIIRVPERLPASLSTLDVKHRNAPAAVRQQEQAIKPAQGGSGGGGIALDLTVNAPQQIFVQGRGLDAELGGSLRLVGPAASPSATGQFTLRRGRLSLLGKRLTFTRGTVGFSGSMVPYLDLAADSTASDATVTIVVSGPATNPKFSFSSSPSLPEDEILARLVFGRSMSNLSPLQIAQLADAVATLTGAGGTSSLLDTLRSKVGVDDIDVKTDANGNAAVSVGKYLNDRTYVTIEKGEGAGSGKATIDLNIGRGVKLRGEATDGGKAKGGIFFEREY